MSPLSVSRTFRTLFLAKLFSTGQISSGKSYILQELKINGVGKKRAFEAEL